MDWIYFFVLTLWAIWCVSIAGGIVFRRHLDQIAPDFRKEP
jgi:hypothetical protein